MIQQKRDQKRYFSLAAAVLATILAEPASAADASCTTTLNDNSTLEVYYDPDTELVNLNVRLPTGSFAGWGWGATMVNTEMVIFSADGDQSSFATYYSSGKSHPDADSTLESCYTSSIDSTTEIDFVSFTVTRPLDCGIESSYVVQLDTDLNVISAWNPDSAQLSFHNDNYLEFVKYFNSDGTCAEAVTECTQTLTDGGRYDVYYDKDTELINMTIKLPDSSFAGWGWGASMQDTEMLIFSANGDSSTVSTYYSSGFQQPDADATLEPCYTSSFESADGFVTFTVTRPLDCGIENSYVIQLDTSLKLIAAWNPNGPELQYHDGNYLEFEQFFNSDGTCAVTVTECTQTLTDGGRYDVIYDSSTELINMTIKIPDSSFSGWGWGATMQDTEMLIFSADGDSSTVSTYYSSGFQPPDADATLEPCYTSSFESAYGFVTFTVTRPLDCGIENSYVVQLDTDLSLIAAWNANGPELQYHDENYLEFQQYLNSDSTCTVPENTSCTQDLNDGGSFTVFYDPDTEQMSMNCTIPAGSYAGWGWGASMVDTEMVIFSADGDQSSVATYYSSGKSEPDPDSTLESCYTSEITQKDNGFVEFITTRPLDCGVSNTYAIELNTQLSLITAWNPDSPELSYHDGNRIEFNQLFSPTGTCQYVETSESHNLPYYIHGILMWTAWALIGLLQIYTNRYWKRSWRWNKIVHAALGFFSMAIVVTAGFIALKTGGWTINSDSSLHAKMGFSMFIIGLALMLGGMAANIIRLKVPMEWNTRWVLRVGKFHRYLGWYVVIITQVTIGSGLVNFYSYEGKDTLGWSIAGSSAALFFIGLIFGEVKYQILLRKKVELVAPDATMTEAEFEQALLNGRKLMILDELVLDVGKFIDQHPGGRFVLMHNNGRDISKFFYGGYSLEDNLGRKPAQGYAHSSFAHHVVNDLAIARYEPQVAVASTECTVVRELCQEVNPNTAVIVMQNTEGNVKVPNFKAFFHNPNYIAKHFLIRSLEGSKSVARHYTICNAMRPDIYRNYIQALKPEDDPDFTRIDTSLLNKEEDNKMAFCIKNYQHPKGLSTKIHQEPQNNMRYEVKGPMGHGLRCKESGVHIAFAAGTGALCFTDLVAFLIRANLGVRTHGSSIQNDVCNTLGMSNATTGGIDAESFQFYLYVSYPRRADGVALELFEAFENYCRRENVNNFHLYVRLSQEGVNPQRWDENFIRQEIGKFDRKEIKRVWVCGPPVMNETFDRFFSARDHRGRDVSDEHEGEQLLDNGSRSRRLTRDQYEIL